MKLINIIIVVMTNLTLDNDELKQMNHQLNVIIGKTIRRFNTFTDGDIFKYFIN